MTAAQIEIHKWTAQEFKRLVLESNPKVAVFDCDGTLWGGDAGYGFMAWSLEQGLVSRSTSDWIDTRHRAYRSGQVSEEEICGEMVQIYAGLRDQELRAAAAQYVKEFVRRPHLSRKWQISSPCSEQAGVDLWAVSSTNRWVVAEGVRDFRIPEDHILAAEVRVKDGLITSEILDVPTDEGKAVALKRVGLDRSRRGLRQLHPRSRHARNGPPPLPRQPLSRAARSRRKERLGLLPPRRR